MSSTELAVWTPSDASREHIREYRRRKRHERRWIWGIGLGCVVTFAGALTWLTLNQPPEVASAADVAPVETTLVAPATTYPTPETVPPETAPGWTSVRVQLPGWDDQGKLVTDGVHAGRDNLVLVGSVGVAIVAIKADFAPFANAATAVVGGIQWRITSRGTVPQNDISSLFRRPVEPVLVLISTLPGTDRAYLEARR